MTDTKKEAQRVMQQIYKHGVIHLYRGDDGKAYAVPGHSVEFVGVYREPVKQADIESDLQFTQGT